MCDLCSWPPLSNSGVLLVGHDDHAVPVRFGLLEHVFLAALPESARGAVVRPTFQQSLEIIWASRHWRARSAPSNQISLGLSRLPRPALWPKRAEETIEAL